MFTLGEIIELAIRIENNGENTYRKARKEVSDPSLASMLQWLAEDEAEHKKWFIKLRENADMKVEDSKVEEMGTAILKDVLGDMTFSLNEADFSKIEDIRSLLELSVEFEKDTIVFYEMLGAFIGDEETASQLDKIIEEEQRHVQVLEEFLEKGEPLPVKKN